MAHFIVRAFLNCLHSLPICVFAICAILGMSALTQDANATNSLTFLGSATDPDGSDGAYYAIVKDEGNNLLYVGTDYSGALSDGPARVVKFNMGTGDNPPTRVGHITLQAGENDLRAGAIDTVNGFAYFGTNTIPGKIVKVRLSDFTRVGVLTLQTGENGLFCAHLDPAGYAWFGTDTSPGKIIKIRLSDFTRLGTLTLDSGENQLRCNIIVDPANNLGYFGTFTSPGQVVRVNLGTGNNLPTRIDDMTMPAAVSFLRSAEINLTTDEAFYGTFQFPATIAKIKLGAGPAPIKSGLGPMDLIDYAFCPFGALKLMILIFGVTPRNEKLADSTDQMAGFFETDPGAYTFFGGLQVDEDPTLADSNTTTEMKNFYSGVAVQESRHFYVTSFTDGELGKFKAAIITPSPTPTATPSPTPSPTPIQDASNTGGTVPAQLAAGYTHPATLTMTNTGESVWTSPSGYSLAVQSDSCNLLLGATRIGMPGNPTINPGQSVIFDLNLKAPASNGPCTLQVQMVQEFVTFFGQTVTVNPTVVSPVKDSQFISHTIPATMAPNQGLQVGVTIRNLGNMVWRPGGRFILDEVSDACGLLQGPVGPVDNVHPNQTQQFFPYLTAPGSPQSCHLELRMHEDIGVAAIKDEQLFGNPPVPFGATFALDIQIQTPPNASHLWEIYQ